MKVTRTIQEIINFANLSFNYCEKNKDETKLSRSLFLMAKQCETAIKEYHLAVEDFRLEHCMVDEKTRKSYFY